MVAGADAVARRNNVQVMGRGKTLVLAHGLGTDQSLWQSLVHRLASEYRLVLFDHAGCGQASRAAYESHRYTSLDAYANDLTEVVECFGGVQPTLLAHSISGALGIMASVLAPSLFERMILLAPSPRFLDDPPDYRGGLTLGDVEDFLGLMEQNFLGWATAFANTVASGDTARRMFEAFCSTDPAMLRAFATLAFHVDVRALLPRVSVPTLIVQCLHDAIVAPEVGALMHAMTARSSYRTIDVSGHCPHVSHPEVVEQIVREYRSPGP